MEEKRLLLPNNSVAAEVRISNSESTTCSSSSEDEYIENLLERAQFGNKIIAKNKQLQMHPSLFNSRRRYQIHRGVRRIVRPVFTVVTPLLFLTLYLLLYTNVHTRQFALPDWGYNTSRNIADYVLPENDTTLLKPRGICRDKLFLLIIVCSGINNFVERQTIRETWGNTTEFNYGMFSLMHANLRGRYLRPAKSRIQYYRDFLGMNKTHTIIPDMVPVRVVFLIGKHETNVGNETLNRIRNESEHYNDMIQENFIDTYNNLTIKSVLALKWVTRHCLNNTAFLMKCDVDTFVHIPNLIHVLLGGTVPLYNNTLEYYDIHTYQALYPSNRLNMTKNLLMGHLFCTARPIANVSSKWYMPYYMYPGDKYPKYLSGAGYVMSIDVVPRLYEAALNTSLIYMEDVYLTGVCAEKIHLQRRNYPIFSYTYSKEMCTYKGIITQHELKDDALIVEAYAFVKNVSNHCTSPESFMRVARLRKATKCA